MQYSSIKKIIINNYKNLLINNSLELHSLNILIGPNCCGKSNFIGLFNFLTGCVTAREANIGLTGLEVAVDHLGGTKILNSKIAPPASVHFEFEFSQTDMIPHGSVFELELNIPSDGKRITVYQELLRTATKNDEAFFSYYECHHKRTGEGFVSISNESAPDNHFKTLSQVPINDLALTNITKLLENSQLLSETVPLYQVRRYLIEMIAQWRFYNANNMNLHDIRHYEPKIGGQDIWLSASGENLSRLLFNLNNQYIDFEEIINNAMKSILPTTRRVRAIPSGRLGLTIEWYFEDIQEPFYLNEMSDGAVRMLCWAAILNSPFLPPLLVIDEPELGLHVAWMKILATWIKKAARKTQVIVTTHSPDLLDHFTDNLEDVICFCREKSDFVPKPLSRQRLSKALQEGWQLGDLYRVGEPDVGGWPW